jgi:hypothetical protein
MALGFMRAAQDMAEHANAMYRTAHMGMMKRVADAVAAAAAATSKTPTIGTRELESNRLAAPLQRST